jgi:calcineurin-like phosphoesterase family protein
MIYLLPDTHLGHKKMIEYCDRLRTINSGRIKPNDTLIHMDDVAIGWSFDMVKRFFDLDCKKVLILGNHDKAWSVTKWSRIFDFVCTGIVIKNHLLITHKPTIISNDYKNIHTSHMVN